MSNATLNASADNAASAPTTTEVLAVDQATPQADNAAPAPAQDQVADDATQNTDDTQGSAPDGEQSKAVKELIAQRKKRQQAEQEAAYWRGVAQGNNVQQPQQAQQAPPPDAPPAEPVVDDYPDFGSFERAREKWIIETAKYEIKKEYKQTMEQESKKATMETFQKRVSVAISADPSFGELVHDPTMPLNAVIVDVLQHSELPVDIIKYLGQHRDEAVRIASMPPIMAAKELGMIEAQIKYKPKSEPPKKVSQAPDPLQTVNPVGVVPVGDTELPIDQFINKRNKAQFGR